MPLLDMEERLPQGLHRDERSCCVFECSTKFIMLLDEEGQLVAGSRGKVVVVLDVHLIHASL